MDLSAVARQKARGGRAEPASPSATASMEADDHDSEGSDDDQPDPESAKQYVKQFVKNSLDGVRGGRRAQYYEVLEALDGLASATPSGDPDKLLMLEVLGENVSSLDERLHEELLRRVMGTSLWLCHEDIARLVVQFCVNLMSTHTGSMLATCLDMLVEAFLPPRGYPEGRLEDELDAYMRTGQSPSLGADAIREDMDDDESDPKGPPPRSAAETTAMIVGAITQILTLVPLSATVLGGILLRRIPHKTAVKARQCQYLRAAFALVETPAGRPLRDGLLRGVVRHLLDVDVEIKWQDIAPDGDLSEDDETEVEDEEDDGKENGAGGIFELEDIEKTIEQELVRQAAAWERGESGASGARQGSIRSPMHHGGRDEIEEQIDMIDSMMTLVLAHIDRRIDSGDGVALNECLLKVFVSTLLPAHESKFTQFLVFHACAREAAAKATSPALGANGPRVANAVGEFDGTGALSARIVDQLIGRVTDPIARPAPRLASAAYLASFLARAAWLRPPFLAATLRRLASWCWATVESATSGAVITTSSRYAHPHPTDDATAAPYTKPSAVPVGIAVKKTPSHSVFAPGGAKSSTYGGSITSCSRTRFGCRKWRISRISRRMRFASTASTNTFSTFLIATSAPACLSRAATTQPYEPLPSSLVSSYRGSMLQRVPANATSLSLIARRITQRSAASHSSCSGALSNWNLSALRAREFAIRLSACLRSGSRSTLTSASSSITLIFGSSAPPSAPGCSW